MKVLLPKFLLRRRNKKDKRCNDEITLEVGNGEVLTAEVIINREFLTAEINNREVLTAEVSDREVLTAEVTNKEVFAPEILTAECACANKEIFIYTEKIDIDNIPRDVTHVRIHASVRVIASGAFKDCLCLEVLELNEGLEEIGKSAFFRCHSLKQVMTPSTLKIISAGAFARCIGLKELHLNEGLNEIGMVAFDECQSLNHVDIPSTLNVISDWAFLECTQLERVTLCEGLQIIGKEAFYACQSLRIINIPSTVKEIGKKAFTECDKLREVDFHICSDWVNAMKLLFGTGAPIHWIAEHNLSRLDHRASSLSVQPWRAHIQNRCRYLTILHTNSEIANQVEAIQAKLMYYEAKEATSLIELLLWKMKINEIENDLNSEGRVNCRQHCGAEIIIPMVLPFLIDGDMLRKTREAMQRFTEAMEQL